MAPIDLLIVSYSNTLVNLPTCLTGSKLLNEERPHEALRLTTPSSVYVASTRCYPATLPESI